MKYYKISYSRKSCCERPNPWMYAYICAKDDEDFDQQFKRITRFCEEYEVEEITEEKYRKYGC